MAIRTERIDELIATSGSSLIGPDGLAKELTKALVERMLAGGMNHRPGYPKHDAAGNGSGNSRNGKSRKTLKGDAGHMTIDVPGNRNGTFEPQLIGKHQTRFEGFDAKIPSMYGLGMTVGIFRATTAETVELALAAFRVKYPKHQAVADVRERNG